MLLSYNLMLILIILIIWIIINNLKFNLSGVHVIQGDHQNNSNLGLDFIKSENLKKSELLQKVKELSSSIEKEKIKSKNEDSLINKTKNYFSLILKIFFTFKALLLKLTFLSLVVQILKKYKIFRRVWFLLNTLVLTIYGIFLFDNSFFDFIKNLFNEIHIISWNVIEYLSDTKFYHFLSNLFSNNEVIDTKEVIGRKQSINKEIIQNDIEKAKLDEFTKRIKKENLELQKNLLENTKTRLSELLNPNKIENINQKEVIISDNDISYKKYLIISSLIISGILAWYYSEEIITGYTSLMEWLMSFRPGGGDNTGNNSNTNSTTTWSNISRPLNEDNYFKEIELIDKGKAKPLTSPSLEVLNEEAKELWSRTPSSPPSSPSSSSSTETITPSAYRTFTQSLSDLNRVRQLVEELNPQKTIEKMNWIEANIKDIDNTIIKEEIIKNFKFIESNQNQFISRFSTIISEGLIKDNSRLNQMEFQINRINQWINKYSSEIND